MSSRRVLLPLFGVVVLLLAMVATLWWHRSQAADEPRGNAIVEALSGEEVGGYARALTPGALQFPRDLGAHPDYRTEWWYYTGNLETQEGREFGFQLTFFRTALAPPGRSATGTSAFRTSQIYFAHFAVSDVERERFFQDEQFARGAAGLAGAEAVPYHVWVNDWAAQELKDGRVALQAQSEEAEIMLYLTPTLPPVLHGDEGLSRKGARPGNASYYYSIVRQEVRGEVGVGGKRYAVTGLAWHDHEYSTSALEEGAVGWDWFSLQFNSGAALMLYQIRRADGSSEPWSAGSFVWRDGTVTKLTLYDWQVEEREYWLSPTTQRRYPTRWYLVIPRLGLELEVEALMPNQELTVSTTYWEGAVKFAGRMDSRGVEGRGYVEMTGR